MPHETSTLLYLVLRLHVATICLFWARNSSRFCTRACSHSAWVLNLACSPYSGTGPSTLKDNTQIRVRLTINFLKTDLHPWIYLLIFKLKKHPKVLLIDAQLRCYCKVRTLSTSPGVNVSLNWSYTLESAILAASRCS